MEESNQVSTEQPLRLTGRVKWFNDKSGFGFITVCDDGPYHNSDIFIHYSAINRESSPYKYLVQGEYVEFDLEKSNNEKHEYHAKNISGIKNGILMCETHRLNALSRVRPDNRTSRSRSSSSYDRPTSRKIRDGSRQTNDNIDGFVTVRRKRVKPVM